MIGKCRRSRRFAAVFLALMTVASVASAQTPAPASQQLEFLGASFAQAFQGREVWITTSNGQRQKARLGLAFPAGLNVTPADGQVRTIPFAEIRKIEKVTHRMRNHMVAGAIIGSGLGLLGAFACEDDGACVAALFGVYAGIGVGVGALNGAIRNNVNRDDDLIYRGGGAPTMAWAVSPVVSRGRKGVMFSLSWR